MKKWYTISIHGCDDSTEVEMMLSHEEFEFMEHFKDVVNDTSTYGCMPSMVIKEGKHI